MHKKSVLCLANSRKLNGRCIAGIEFRADGTHQWVRPVSNLSNGEIPTPEAVYPDGRPIQVMDLIEMNLKSPQPKTYQSENWLIADGVSWRRMGRFDVNAIANFVSGSSSLWLNGRSSGIGENDRMAETEAANVPNSLQLIHVDNLELQLMKAFSNHSVNLRARFEHKSTVYSLKVTDPSVEKQFSSAPLGKYPTGSAYLTISLGEPFKGFVYKLVAAIIPVTYRGRLWRS